MGWKPSGGGDTFTYEADKISSAQWSRAARGFELKMYSKDRHIIQLDGFLEEVSISLSWSTFTNGLLVLVGRSPQHATLK
jgi:POB3-like N-terminal PH domain